MERKEFLKSKKYYLKGLAQQLIQLKIEFKELERNRRGCSYDKGIELTKIKYEYRHEHIAYSMARGRTYKQIEQTVRENNEPNIDYFRKLLNEYPILQTVDDETVICINQE